RPHSRTAELLGKQSEVMLLDELSRQYVKKRSATSGVATPKAAHFVEEGFVGGAVSPFQSVDFPSGGPSPFVVVERLPERDGAVRVPSLNEVREDVECEVRVFLFFEMCDDRGLERPVFGDVTVEGCPLVAARSLKAIVAGVVVDGAKPKVEEPSA